MRAARSQRARRTLGAVCVRRAGLPRRGENRFLRPMQKESLVFKQRPLRRFLAPCARALSASTTGTFIERGRGGRGSGRGGPMPRARVFSFCPAYPRRQGGAGSPCPRLAVGRVPAPASALSPWPLAGRLRAVRGARRGLGWPAPAWLRPGVAAVSRRSLSRSVRLSASAAVRAARRRAAARAWRSSWVCPFCGSSSCLPVVSSCGAVFASPSCPGDLGGDSGW